MPEETPHCVFILCTARKSGSTHPQQADLDLFFEVMDVLKGERVFVHCAANARVSG